MASKPLFVVLPRGHTDFYRLHIEALMLPIFTVTKIGTATENRTPINEMKTRCTNRYTIAAENVQVIDGLAHMLYRLVIRYGHLNKALKCGADCRI